MREVGEREGWKEGGRGEGGMEGGRWGGKGEWWVVDDE